MSCKPARLELERFCQMVLDEVGSATNRACPIRFTATRISGAARGDERLLRQILTNLLSNAIKYSAPGQPVDFLVERADKEAVITIRDRGIGIPAEDLPKLFHTFQRARNVGQRPGSGLGLTIVRECVHLHGGRIAIESHLGEGTCVTIRLPLFVKARNSSQALP
jgi:signal transduction histidine kinase